MGVPWIDGYQSRDHHPGNFRPGVIQGVVHLEGAVRQLLDERVPASAPGPADPVHDVAGGVLGRRAGHRPGGQIRQPDTTGSWLGAAAPARARPQLAAASKHAAPRHALAGEPNRSEPIKTTSPTR
jgi:hypothetical protein